MKNSDSDSSGHVSASKRVCSMVSGFLDGRYVDQNQCQKAFDRMHHRDAIGDRLHLFFACIGLLFFFGPVTVTELALAPLAVFFFVRVFNTAPIWIHGFGQPTILLAIVLALWMMISLNWSLDPSHGWGEIAELRWFLIMPLLFPVIEHRALLIRWLAIGIALGQVGQFVDFFDGFGIEPLANLVENHPGRVGGLWHPVVGGSLLVAGMGLHAPAAFYSNRRASNTESTQGSQISQSRSARIFSMVGFLICMLGVLLTGSRGAWIASVLLIVFILLFGAIRRWLSIRLVLGGAMIGGLFMATGAWFARDGLASRINETRQEFRDIQEGNYDSYTGYRVLMAQIALRAIDDQPVIGVGAGGYEAWGVQEHNKRHAEEVESLHGLHAHAHNSGLQIWSTLGLVGVVVWGVLIFTIMRNAWSWGQTNGRDIASLGPMLGLIGLGLASITDVVHINTQTAAMMGLLVALSPAKCPGHPLWNPSETQMKTK